MKALFGILNVLSLCFAGLAVVFCFFYLKEKDTYIISIRYKEYEAIERDPNKISPHVSHIHSVVSPEGDLVDQSKWGYVLEKEPYAIKWAVEPFSP